MQGIGKDKFYYYGNIFKLLLTIINEIIKDLVYTDEVLL